MSSHDVRSSGQYYGEALRAVAMPLGGLGTGTIALAGDGSLRQWQIHNQINHLACVPHSFFAVWARTAKPLGEPVARVLQSAALYEHPGPIPPPTSNDHLVPTAHRELLRELPGVAAIEFTGRYPIAELTYLDDAIPLRVTMEAFNPLRLRSAWLVIEKFPRWRRSFGRHGSEDTQRAGAALRATMIIDDGRGAGRRKRPPIN